jgi:multiple sugar transport system substrate-binding protein
MLARSPPAEDGLEHPRALTVRFGNRGPSSWLAHWLDFAGDHHLPPLLAPPFWLDPSDSHRMVSVTQFLRRPPRTYDYTVTSGEWRHIQVMAEMVWPKAVHRVVTDGLTPEQAADEAIARVKQMLSE